MVSMPSGMKGIPLLSAFRSADNDAAIFRRFSRLGARNLLHFQNHLNALEAKLHEFDKRDAKDAQGNPSLRQGARAYDSMRDAADEYRRRLSGAPEDQNGTLDTPENRFLKDSHERVELHREIAIILHQYRMDCYD